MVLTAYWSISLWQEVFKTFYTCECDSDSLPCRNNWSHGVGVDLCCEGHAANKNKDLSVAKGAHRSDLRAADVKDRVEHMWECTVCKRPILKPAAEHGFSSVKFKFK